MNDHMPSAPLDQTPAYIHKTVLLVETLEGLNIRPHTTIVDATFGGGGHTRAILEAEPTVKVIAIDWDTHAIRHNAPPLKGVFGDRFTAVWGNFAHLPQLLKKINVDAVDGILADVGTSQFQIHHREGFSFQHDTPLDMRMSNAHSHVTAASFLNSASEKELADVFWQYGEERYARPIAREIVTRRKHQPFTTTKQLADLVAAIFRQRTKDRHYRIHPATRVFQALRIYINDELEHLQHFLRSSIDLLQPHGRLAVISFHSLEDRIVKHFMREHANTLVTITKKPIVAHDAEQQANPSARSAKLRIAEKRAIISNHY
jgi:16S rRNA (cytosine1402-N4)-methyltransferase